jgi:hypothetical protein
MSLNQAEPALLLTPPDAASEQDDGLLTASEVAKLRLDADWVILSACNTAAADGTPSAEALSGLASAFLYAGARSLVGSHWYVNSEAAVKLTTDMFAEPRRKPDTPRAEALRRSIGRGSSKAARGPIPLIGPPSSWSVPQADMAPQSSLTGLTESSTACFAKVPLYGVLRHFSHRRRNRFFHMAQSRLIPT